MHSFLLSHIYEQLLLNPHFKIHKFQGQKYFWTKCVQMGYKKNFINSIPFALLIINVKILSNFQKEQYTFGIKKNIWKKQGLSIFKVWVFEHVKIF
jgi:hypothetical protein